MPAMKYLPLKLVFIVGFVLVTACENTSPKTIPTTPPVVISDSAMKSNPNSPKGGLEIPESDQTAVEKPSLDSKVRHIVFSSQRDGNFEIYVMGDTGGNQQRLTSNTSDDNHPDWSPDGTKIVFQSDRNDLSGSLIRRYEIYSMDIDGSNQVRLTTGNSSNFRPDWSPDGSRIVFNSERDGVLEIYVMNADGTGQTRLTQKSFFSDMAPRWSPDGEKIAFYSTRDGVLEIYAMNSDGSNQTRLTFSDSWDVYPSWSPDGEKITYFSERDGNQEIYVMNRDGTHQTRITSNDSSDNHPAWSADGTRIVFTSNRDDTIEIYVMEADGSNQMRLTNAQADWFPSWAPLRSPLDSGTSTSTATAVASVVRIQHEQTFVISNQVPERVRVTLNHNLQNDYDFSDFIILNANSEEDENLGVHSIFFRGDETNPAIVEIVRYKPSSQSGEYTIRYFSVD